MDIEGIFNDLESNQMRKSEEAKRKLVDFFVQNKEPWLVQNMMDYFLHTGSMRIMEVLVKVQTPHDVYIFDRLSDWLKPNGHRTHALNLFGFIVRRHPTWLFKVEKHKLFKDIFKVLTTEKDIVPLMSALLCIITLLPIIPNLVPNFLNDLFDVFGHLASWNRQNPNRLSDEKLVHLQLGLQMLFHRLYGMYPWNFLNYLSEFIKKDRGAIYYHTIKPLLETVRVHPLLVTASTEKELDNSRWKEIEPHDVVVECAKLSLSVMHQELCNEADFSNAVSLDWLDVPGGLPAIGSLKNNDKPKTTEKTLEKKAVLPKANPRFDCGASSQLKSVIWSPFNEINATGILLTPTPSYILQAPTNVANSLNSQLLSITGSSPPEAAVEATPETTPMKDVKEYKMRSGQLPSVATANPHAVRAILVSSQPTSPMRKERHFTYTENKVPMEPNKERTSELPVPLVEVQFNQVLNRVNPTLQERIVQQIIQDRSSFQQAAMVEVVEGSKVQELDTSNSETMECDVSSTSVANSSSPEEHLHKGCDDCDETEGTLCTAGGLHTPTSKSIQLLGKGLRKRNRMTSYCCNDGTSTKIGFSSKEDVLESSRFRRTKSCSDLFQSFPSAPDSEGELSSPEKNKERHMLKKIGKALAIVSPRHNSKVARMPPLSTNSYATRSTQTVQPFPQNYENTLYEMFLTNNRVRHKHECNMLSPQEILDQYIIRTIKSKDACEAGFSLDQEQFQLLCLQLQYERYRREIHAERNRRLMGRSRDKRSLEMERDRLREQLKSFSTKNEELMQTIDKNAKAANDRYNKYQKERILLEAEHLREVEKNKELQQVNENLEAQLKNELATRKELDYELDSLRGQISSMRTECEHANMQAEIGLRCKQELARLEAEFVVMGEVQIKCRERLTEMDNYKARDKEMDILQESYSAEIKEIKRALEEKSSQLESAKHKTAELQTQLLNNEKVITDQKRLLRTVKDEYEEKFKVLNMKYETQKKIVMQMEEKIIHLHKTQPPLVSADMTASLERNSPLSTSLASSESLSASVRSTELHNLQQFMETPLAEAGAFCAIVEGKRVPSELGMSTSSAVAALPSTSRSVAVTSQSGVTVKVDPRNPPSMVKSPTVQRHLQQKDPTTATTTTVGLYQTQSRR